MQKGSTRKPKPDEPAAPGKNYITPGGLRRLEDEHRFLLTRERPAVTAVVTWAASNGDRSENAARETDKANHFEILHAGVAILRMCRVVSAGRRD